ncbi:MAG TPA: MFS transporter [Acidimicrobiales bacterium]|nr:MFS transporter [Acidimicrobiales bacterium]
MIRTGVDATVDATALEAVLRPRDGLVAEARAPASAASAPDVHAFVMTDGPLRSYRRTVAVATAGAGRWRVRQDVYFDVGVPWFSWLFVLPFRVSLGRLRPAPRSPWWAPPQRIGRRGAVVLATLCALTVVVGYLDNVVTQTMTYVGAEYHVGTTGQGVALGAIQVSAVLALAALVAADRRGRRGLIFACAAGGLALTGLGALATSLAWLTACELLATAAVGALFLLIFVVAAEEMPAGSRAWAAGVLSLSYGLGSGGVLLALPLAGLGTGGWRWLYLIALAGIPVVAVCATTLPESRRFRRPAPVSTGPAMTAGARTGPIPAAWSRLGVGRLSAIHRRRLLVLGGASLAYALFATPAGQFSNQYLRVERHFSALGISVLSQVAGTIGAVGVLVGGRLADTRGRRPVAAVGVSAGTAVTLVTFFAHSWGLWLWAVVASLVSYAVVPALAVYGPELFPTRARSAATGAITALAAAGGVIGLVATGLLSSAFGTIGPALAVLAVGPATMVVLIVVAFPESAGRGLEELNAADEKRESLPAGCTVPCPTLTEPPSP